MANSDKNILITPATNTSGDPRIVYTPNTAANVITQRLTDSGTISFEGSAGQLFSITNSLTGTLFSVNDVSGIPSIDVADTGLVRIAPFGGTLAIGSTAVATSGGVSAKGSITTTATTQPGFIVKGIASQSASLLEIQNSSGSITANFTAPVNNVNRLNLGGTDLSATLGITVHASGGVGQVIRGAASQSANLQEWQSSASTILSRISSSGQFVSDQQTYIGSGATSISNARFNVATGSASVIGQVIRGAASQSANLQEWQDSSANIHSGILSTGFLFVGGSSSAGGQIGITSEAATNRGMVIKGAAAQTANLNEWQDSSSNILASFSPVAQLFLGSNGLRGTQTVAIGTQTPTGTTNITITTGSAHGISVGQTVTIAGVSPSGYNGGWTAQSGTTGTTLVVNIGSNPGTITVAGTVTQSPRLGITALSAQNVPLIVRAASSQVNHLQQWQDSNGAVLARIDGVTGQFQAPSIVSTNFQITSAGVLSVGASSAPANTQSYVLSTAATNVSQVIRGAASQSANLQEWQDSSGNILLAITSSGGIGTSGLTAIRPEANRNVALAANLGSYGGGQAVVFLGNAAAAPSSSPTGGGLLFVNAGALQYRGTSGSAATIVNADGTMSGGSASNTFATISTPSGTSPVADSSTDTLTLTAGTGITITGDSSADSIAIATNATSANTVSAIVARDASGNFSAGTITAATFSGSGASLTSVPAANVTGTLTSTVLGNSALFIGTTSVALNRTTGNLALTGITSITGGTGTTDLDFFTANTTSANSGAIDFITGTTTTSGTTGLILIRSGNSAAASGGVTVSTGTSTGATSGTLTLSTGAVASGAGTSGALAISTGAAGSAGNSGAITMDVGTKTTGSFGTITIGGTNASAITVGNATNTATANLVSSTSVNLNSPAINSNAATLALLATPATITMGAAVTTLTIAGTSTANVTANLATGVTTGSKIVNIGTGGTAGSVSVNIGSSSGSASTVTINGTITGAPTAATATTAANNLGYVGMPQNSQSGAYGLVAGDAGKHIYYTTTGQTVTIPANSNVAFQIGTTITFITAPSVSLSIAITTDTLRLANSTSTGTRTLAANGMATAVKTTATTWIISGNGLT